MAASTNYLESLKTLATSAAQVQKDLLDQQMARATGGKVTTDASGKKTFQGPDPNAYQGTLDVTYGNQQQRLRGSMEARGLLRSGERATKETDLTNTYQQSIIDLFNEIAGKKSGIDAQLARDIADYTAKYGTGTEPTAPPLPKSPQVTDDSQKKTDGTTTSSPYPSTSDKPASQMTPEESFAFVALGQPANKQAATGVTSTPLPAPATTNQYIAAANMALGMPNALQVAAKPPAPAKPAAPKPLPLPQPPKPAPRPAPSPVKKPTPVKMK